MFTDSGFGLVFGIVDFIACAAGIDKM